MAKTKYINNSNKREYTVILTDTEAISIKDFAEDITGNYNPHEDFKIIAKQVKAQVDSNFKEYQKIWEVNRKAQYHNYYNMFKSYPTVR